MFLQASQHLLFYQCIVWEAYLNGFDLLLHYTALSLLNIRVLFLSDKNPVVAHRNWKYSWPTYFPARKLQYGCKWNNSQRKYVINIQNELLYNSVENLQSYYGARAFATKFSNKLLPNMCTPLHTIDNRMDHLYTHEFLPPCPTI